MMTVALTGILLAPVAIRYSGEELLVTGLTSNEAVQTENDGYRRGPTCEAVAPTVCNS